MNLFTFVVGIGFGFLIVATRLSDYTAIHNMLLLREPDIYLLMASSFAVAMPLLWILRRRSWKTPMAGELSLNRVPNERKHVYGGALFGAGWATAGTCPWGTRCRVVLWGGTPAHRTDVGTEIGGGARHRPAPHARQDRLTRSAGVHFLPGVESRPEARDYAPAPSQPHIRTPRPTQRRGRDLPQPERGSSRTGSRAVGRSWERVPIQ